MTSFGQAPPTPGPEDVPPEFDVTDNRPRRGRPLKHGAYSKFALGPMTNQKRREVLDILEREGRPMAPGDELMVDMLARMLAKIVLIDRWMAANGIFRDESKGELNPVFQDWKGAVITARQLMNDLGLTSLARVRLKMPYAQPQDLGAEIHKAKQQ